MKTREHIISKMKSLSKDFDIAQKEYLKDGLGSFEHRGILLMQLRSLSWVIGLKEHDKFITTK